jgi:phosphoglycerate dehydrogenase-like enzyme
MQGQRILITRAIFPETIARLSEHFEVDVNASEVPLPKPELIARFRDKQGVLTVGGDRIDAEVLDACPGLRICANFGVGYDNLDIARGALQKESGSCVRAYGSEGVTTFLPARTSMDPRSESSGWVASDRRLRGGPHSDLA